MKIKDYVKQFYNEGFATTFYQKPTKYINKKVKNKNAAKFVNGFIKVLYTIVFLGIAVIYIYSKLK